jgi:hypothetical protein
MLDIPSIKRRLDTIAADANRIAAALAHHAARSSDPALRGQLHRLEMALREVVLAVSVTPVPAGLS